MHHAPPINIDVLSPPSSRAAAKFIIHVLEEEKMGGGTASLHLPFSPPILISYSSVAFFKKDGSWPGKAVRRSGSFSHPPPLRPLCIPLPTALGEAEGRRTHPPARNFYKSSQCQLQIGGRSRRGGERGGGGGRAGRRSPFPSSPLLLILLFLGGRIDGLGNWLRQEQSLLRGRRRRRNGPK